MSAVAVLEALSDSALVPGFTFASLATSSSLRRNSCIAPCLSVSADLPALYP
jgi:hypothetical protein